MTAITSAPAPFQGASCGVPRVPGAALRLPLATFPHPSGVDTVLPMSPLQATSCAIHALAYFAVADEE